MSVLSASIERLAHGNVNFEIARLNLEKRT
jgi:hypothetical protein